MKSRPRAGVGVGGKGETGDQQSEGRRRGQRRARRPTGTLSRGTDPRDPDTDGDGHKDGDEVDKAWIHCVKTTS